MNIGSFCLRSPSATHAAQLAEVINQDPDVITIIGPRPEKTGVDAQGVDVFDQTGAVLLYVITRDSLAPEGSEPWLYEPEFWGHTFGGHELTQLASAEQATVPDRDTVLSTDVPVPLTREERLANRELRSVRREAITEVLAARADLEVVIAKRNAFVQQVQDLPAVRTDAVALLVILRAERDAKIADRTAKGIELDGYIAIAQDAANTTPQRQAAREARDIAVAEINAIIREIDGLNAQIERNISVRDWAIEALPQARIDRDEANAQIIVLRDILNVKRAEREAAKAALNP